MSDIRPGVICETCAIFVLNNDDSSASENWNRECAVNTVNRGTVIVADSIGFADVECDCCCETLPGNRFNATVQFS